ncbi:hypothetical protein ACWD7F_37180 [Streptomyces sp. NPDC005122]
MRIWFKVSEVKIHMQEDGVSANRKWKPLLTVERAVVEQVEIDQDAGVLVARVRPVVRERHRCGICRTLGAAMTRGAVSAAGVAWCRRSNNSPRSA